MSWFRGSIWRNKKNGDLYKVVGMAKNANNALPEPDGTIPEPVDDDMVVYRKVGEQQLFYRRPDEFILKFTKELPEEDH